MKIEQVENEFSIIKDYLLRVLPQGSGIDCAWDFDYQRNGKILASNAFHCMDENGFYCGYADFTLRIDLGCMGDFRLSFKNNQSHLLARRHMLRDYLEETLYYALTSPQETYEQFRTMQEIPCNG